METESQSLTFLRKISQNRKQKAVQLAIAFYDFPTFVREVFSESVEILKDGQWVGGDYIEELAKWYQRNHKTVRVSARDHFKSMSFYARIMWKIYRMQREKRGREINYFSYKESMARYHVNKIKKAIESNPYFINIIDLKPRADGVISYTWDPKNKEHRRTLTVTPRGLLEFKRGIHCPEIYVDDPLQDPENKLVPTKITKVNDAMKKQILDMSWDELHVVGTPQTNFDFFFDENFTKRFAVRINPAIVNEERKEVLWKEWMDWDELQAKKKERGIKAFNQEYLCSPAYTEDAYINIDIVRKATGKRGKHYNKTQWERELIRRENNGIETHEIVGGWDLGKKAHPAHFCLFEKIPKNKTDKNGNPLYTWVEIHDKWMDHWDYTVQLDHIQDMIDATGATFIGYDNTRGELEALDEQGKIPGELNPVNLSHKTKHSLATQMEIAFTNGDIELADINRTLTQIALVNNDLQAPTTPEGHADSFWSIATAFASEGAGVNISFF